MRAHRQSQLHLREALIRIQKLHGQNNPVNGSPFAKDQKLAPSYPPHQLVSMQLITAGMNLQTLGDAIRMEVHDDGQRRAGGYSNGGLYSCLRSAIETAATALWVAISTDSKIRVTRSYRWWREDKRLGKNADLQNFKIQKRSTDDIESGFLKEMRRFDSWVEQSGISPQTAKIRPSISGILDDLANENEALAYVKLHWMYTSGEAHGRFWALQMAAQEIRQSSQAETVEIRTSPDYVVLERLVAGACELHEYTCQVFWEKFRPAGHGASFGL